MSDSSVSLSVASPNYSAADGLPLRRVSRITPDGRWVWAWQSEWQDDADAAEGRSIAENDAIKGAHDA